MPLLPEIRPIGFSLSGNTTRTTISFQPESLSYGGEDGISPPISRPHEAVEAHHGKVRVAPLHCPVRCNPVEAVGYREVPDLLGRIGQVELVVVHLQFPAVRPIPFPDPNRVVDRPLEIAGLEPGPVPEIGFPCLSDRQNR